MRNMTDRQNSKTLLLRIAVIRCKCQRSLPQNPKTPMISSDLIGKLLGTSLIFPARPYFSEVPQMGYPHVQAGLLRQKSKKLNHHNFTSRCPTLMKLRYSASAQHQLSIAHHIVGGNYGFRVGGFFGTQ